MAELDAYESQASAFRQAKLSTRGLRRELVNPRCFAPSCRVVQNANRQHKRNLIDHRWALREALGFREPRLASCFAFFSWAYSAPKDTKASANHAEGHVHFWMGESLNAAGSCLGMLPS